MVLCHSRPEKSKTNSLSPCECVRTCRVHNLKVFVPPEDSRVTRCVFFQQRNLEGYVGFANLPNQVYRKSVKRGFEFTLMVVGESLCLLLFLCVGLPGQVNVCLSICVCLWVCLSVKKEHEACHLRFHICFECIVWINVCFLFLCMELK